MTLCRGRRMLLWVALSSLATQYRAPAQAPSNAASDVLAKVNAGELAAADAEARATLQANPNSGEANFLLGYVLFREQRYTDSLAAYTAGAKLQTPSPDDLLVVASDYIQLRSYSDAVRWLSYVTEHAPRNEKAWYLLGRSQFMLDHPGDSLAAFERCLALQPRNIAARYNAGLALERLQRPAEAEAAYRQAIAWSLEQRSADPQPWLDLGDLQLAQGHADEAVKSLRVAVEKAPWNPTCQQQLGVALAAAGNNDAAIKVLHRAVELAPNAQRPHFYLGRSLRELGRKSEAEVEFATVSRLLAGHQSEETPNPEAPPSLGGVKLKDLD